MNDTPQSNQNADLPRPRQFTDLHPPTQPLPSLKRIDPDELQKTQEFPIPELQKVSDSPAVHSAPAPKPKPLAPPPVTEADYSVPYPALAYDSDDSGYGAYEEYDRPRSSRSRSSKSSRNSPKKKKSNRKHHHHGGGFLKRFFRKLLTLAFILFAIYSLIAILLIRQLENLPREQRSVTTGSLDEPYVRSVLLIGTDARDIRSERGRSDTMLLVSLNSLSHTMYLTSFMRDAYVQIPGYGSNKLNAAYSYGGAELLMDTLEQNYQVSIDDYCVVSFMGFAGIIDAFGGVNVTLSDEEAKALNDILQSEVNQLAGDDQMSDFLPGGGSYLLNGKQALSYARIRYVGNADFERTSRQREVMSQLLQHAKSNAASAVLRLLSSAMPHLGTNMSDTELYFLSLQAPAAVSYQIQQIQIPADGTFSFEDIDGQSVLQVDFNANIQLLQDSVYSAPSFD